MHVLTGALLAWTALLGVGTRSEAPVVEPQPLDQPSFALLYTNDTRGYLEACG
jgi:hypothetical protein